MKIISNSISFAFIAISAVTAIPTIAEDINTNDRLFYRQLSCQASRQTAIVLVNQLQKQGLSSLEINKIIVDALGPNGLTPGGPRWECCEACVENDLPNSSAACQCCDGLGDGLLDDDFLKPPIRTRGGI